MSARSCAVPRLLNGLDVRGVGLRLDFRGKRLVTGRFDDEVCTTRHDGVGRPAPTHSTGEAPVVGTPAQLTHALDDAIAFRRWIERRRRPHLHRELAPVPDRVHHDDLAGAHDTPGLHSAEADRPCAKDDDIRARLKLHVGMASGETGRQLIAEERQLRRRQIGEDRYAVFLERRHDLAHAADAGLRINRCAVEELRKRREGFDARCIGEERELTVIGAPMQALVALTALRGARDDDAIADLHALDHRADGLDDPESAVVRDLGASDGVGRERAANDRVAGGDCRGSDDDLARIDRQQAHLLDVERVAVPDESAEGAAGLCAGQHSRRLRLLCLEAGCAGQERSTAAERGRARFQTRLRVSRPLGPVPMSPPASRVFYNPSAS